MSQLADAVHCAYDKGYEQGKQDAVKHGRWLPNNYNDPARFICSECGFSRDVDENFGAAICCPNCGAKLDAQEGAEE